MNENQWRELQARGRIRHVQNFHVKQRILIVWTLKHVRGGGVNLHESWACCFRVGNKKSKPGMEFVKEKCSLGQFQCSGQSWTLFTVL